jgi:hypothetical protein
VDQGQVSTKSTLATKACFSSMGDIVPSRTFIRNVLLSVVISGAIFLRELRISFLNSTQSELPVHLDLCLAGAAATSKLCPVGKRASESSPPNSQLGCWNYKMEFRVVASWRLVDPDDDTVLQTGRHLWRVRFAIDARSGNAAPETMLAEFSKLSMLAEFSKLSALSFQFSIQYGCRHSRTRSTVFSCRAAGAR